MVKWSTSLLLIFMSISTVFAVTPANVDHNLPKLTLAIYHSPPYYFTDEHNPPRGISRDIMTSVARALGFELQTISCNFARCLKLLRDGEVDFLAGLVRTPDRERDFYYFIPAFMSFQSSYSFFSRTDVPFVVSGYADLKGKSIAVMRDGRYFQQFDDDMSLNKVAVRSEPMMFEMVAKQRVDLTIAVTETASPLLATLASEHLPLKQHPYQFKQAIAGYLVMSKRSQHYALASSIEKRLQYMAITGELNDILRRYHLPPVSAQSQNP